MKKDLFQKTISELYKKTEKTFCYLYGRWQDEKEYEDFGDYEKAMKDAIEKSGVPVKFSKMTKRPFGVQMIYEGYFKITMFVKSNGATYRVFFDGERVK